MLAHSSQSDVVEALRKQFHEESIRSRPTFPSGLPGELPRAFRRGTLVEYLAEGGSGATTVALMTAREACREGGVLVIVDRLRTFYPPSADAYGIGNNAILVRPRSQKDEIWALNQTLRCPGVGAALCWLDKVEERAFRGLQIAAEKSGAVGLFIRPVSVRGRPAWSETQLLVEAMLSDKRRRMRIEVIRSRTGHEGLAETVELDDETTTLQTANPMSVAAGLASAARAVSASGA